MKVFNHAILLPPELYSGSDKITALNNNGFGFKSYSFIAMYMENQRTGKRASKDINEEVKNAMFDLGNDVIFAAKNHGFTDIPAICSKPSFESKARYRVVEINNFSQYRFITIEKLLDVLAVEGKKLNNNPEQVEKINKICELLSIEVDEWGDLGLTDYVYLPSFGVVNTPDTWEHLVMMIPGKIASATCFISDADVNLIHPKEIIHFSNRKVLDNNSFFTLRKLLQSPETEEMAMKMINNCNISLSLVQVALLINYLPIKTFHKKKSPLPNVSMWFPIDGKLKLDEIVEIINSEHGGNNPLSNDELEFIADNYYTNLQQKTSYFEFKIVPKKK